MSSFGPVERSRKREFTCQACQDEIPHRLGGVTLDNRYRMRGPVCGHPWPKFAFRLAGCTAKLVDAGLVNRWTPVKERGR